MSRWLWEKGTSRLEYQKVKVLVAQSCPTLDPIDCSPPGSSDCGIFQAKRVGSHSLFQGIFLTQGLNPGLLHCRRILYHLGHQGNLAYCELATKVKLVKNTVSVTSQYLWSAIKQSTIKCGLPVVHSEDFLLITPPSFRLQLPGGVHSGGQGRQSAPGQLRSYVWIQMGGSQDGPLLEVCG